LRKWILRHDDSWLFTIAYIGSAVLLSIFISLFWLVAVVAVHFAFEWVRQAAREPAVLGVLRRTSWHLKLDLALVAFALVLAVYMEAVLGVVGLGGAARVTAQAGSRAARLGGAARVTAQAGSRVAGWARVIRGVALSLDDAAQVARAAGRAVKRKDAGEEGEAVEDDGKEGPDLHPWRRWGVGDHVAIWLGALCLVATLAAPFVLDDLTFGGVLETIAEEFHPWPGSGD